MDVYADWVDACDAVKDSAGPTTTVAPPAARARPTNASARQGLAPGEKMTEEDAQFIEDDEADAEAEYAD